MYKVSFALKKNSVTKLSLVSVRAYLKSGTFQASTGIIIPHEDWSTKTQSLKRTSTLTNAAQINERLASLKATLRDICLSSQSKSTPITVQEVKAKWKAANSKVKATPKYLELGAFIQSIIEEKESMNVPTRNLGMNRNCLKHVLLFEKYSGKTLISQYDEDTLTEFTRYMLTNANQYSNLYCHKIISQLKTFLRIAYKKKLLPDITFLDNKIPVSKKAKDTIYLTMSEIHHLYNLKLENKSLNQTRNLFLVGCLTGLRYSDYSRLRKEHIQVIEHEGKSMEAIVIFTQKTKKNVVVPLTNPMLKELLGNISQRKPISSQKFNDQLKEVAKLAGFNNKVFINQFRAGRHEVEFVEKWQLFNSHLARRSFCSNAFKAGIPVQNIMNMTGHTSVATFMQYLKLSNEEATFMIAEHPFFKGN